MKGINETNLTLKAAGAICIAVAHIQNVAHAIPNLTIAVQGSDVVLTWPSQAGAEYIVQYRPTLLPENPWATLANNHPASAGQFTTYTHVGIFTCPPLAPGGGSGGGGSPPPPGGMQSMTSHGELIPFWDGWLYEGRDPYPWEAEKRPPYPWEAAYWELAYGGNLLWLPARARVRCRAILPA